MEAKQNSQKMITQFSLSISGTFILEQNRGFWTEDNSSYFDFSAFILV